MRFGEPADKKRQGSEPITMKKRNYQNKRRRLCVWLYGILVFCTFLSGCGRTEAEFLVSQVQEEAEQAPALTPQIIDEPKEAAAKTIPSPSLEEAEIYVDICGAVANPGVYSLKPGSRVFQAIEMAGGFLPGAAAEYINRARGLSDGEQVYIPTQEEAEAGELPAPDSHPENADEAFASGMDGKINLNTANAEELMTLNGIGATRAQAILVYREEHGGFSSIEEIMNVQGIKEGTFEKIKDNIVIE